MDTQTAKISTTRRTLDMSHLEMAYDQTHSGRQFPQWLRGSGPIDRSITRLQAAGLLDDAMACTAAGRKLVEQRRSR